MYRDGVLTLKFTLCHKKGVDGMGKSKMVVKEEDESSSFRPVERDLLAFSSLPLSPCTTSDSFDLDPLLLPLSSR